MAPSDLLNSAGIPAVLRILVADDDEMLRTAVRGLLRGLGHSEERESYATMGMDQFLVKPVRLADLVDVIGHRYSA